MLWAGGEWVAVPAINTSRTCPRCGHISKDNRKSQAAFVCVECGLTENADLVAAINILHRGLKKLEGQDTAELLAGCQSTARIAGEVNCERSSQLQETTERAA